MTSILLLLSLQLALAGHDVGSGGDVVECKQSPDNQFSGTYSLDYLLTYKDSNKNADLAAVKSLEQSLLRIQKNIDSKLPELSESFNEFTKLIRNEDVSKPRFWEEAPFGLVDIKDEDIINQVPMNCRQNGQVKIVQTIIRMNPTKTGTAKYKLIYKYVPSLFQKLYENSPIQLSFLIVHEWLWDFSHNVEKNRRLNRIFHSQDLETLSASQLRTKLTTLGLEIPKSTAPPFMNFDSCPADSFGAKNLMSQITKSERVTISRDLTFLRRSQRCPLDGVDGCLQSTSSYIVAQAPIELQGGVDAGGQKYLYFYSNLTGQRVCRVEEDQATIECAVYGSNSYGVLEWFLPSGTVGKSCIRLYDSNFFPGTQDKGVPVDGSLDELVLMIKY